MVEELARWLRGTLEERGWSRRELARRLGVSHTSVTNVAAGRAAPSARFCQEIAHVLDVPVEQVYQLAGLLPQDVDETTALRQANLLFSQLSEAEQDIVLTQMRALVERRKRGIQEDAQPG